MALLKKKGPNPKETYAINEGKADTWEPKNNN